MSAPKSLGQQAYERMRDHNDNASTEMNDRTAWKSLTPSQRLSWEVDARARPHLYGLPAAPQPSREPQELVAYLKTYRPHVADGGAVTVYVPLTLQQIDATIVGLAEQDQQGVDEDWIRGLIGEAIVMNEDQERADEGDEELSRISDAVLKALRPYLSTTPARAEAQDEGAAGERERIARLIDPNAWVFFDLATAPFIEGRGAQGDEGWVYNITWHKLGFRQVPEVRKWLLEGPVRPGVTCGAHTDLLASLAKADAILAHPSPTPAADADRVRIAVEALEEIAHLIKISPDVPSDDFDRGARAARFQAFDIASPALAALKSTAAKEGEKS